MVELQKIPFLIKLLDDDSSEIRSIIIRELSTFGCTLRDEIRKVPVNLNQTQRQILDDILWSQDRQRVKKTWAQWCDLAINDQNFLDDLHKLESGLSILSQFLNRYDSAPPLGMMLDELAFEFKTKYDSTDAKDLVRFLFKDKGIKGNETDYYNPQNSNLSHVISAGRGIPISLTALLILVGGRLGIRVEGCPFPGHFLGCIYINGRRAFVDCFSNGQIIEERDILTIKDNIIQGQPSILEERADAEMIVRRFLANLIRAYQSLSDDENQQLMIDLFKDLDIHMVDKNISSLTPDEIIADNTAQFSPGEIVRHKIFGYRGIIVEVDTYCKATDHWYYGNQNQPSRDQAWYHVLVHGTDQVTYVAESNLTTDNSQETIDHPLLSYFFLRNDDGGYQRNKNPWPDSDNFET